MSEMPTLPPITDMDTVLAVFMHESLPSPPNENIGDPKRLVHLGERVLEQAIAYHYFMKRPILPAEEVEALVQNPPWNFHHLLYQYQLVEKIRTAPGHYIDTAEEAKLFFCKYMGAAFIHNGMGSIQEWVSQTLDPGCITPSLPTGNPPSNFSSAPPPPSIPPPRQPPPPSGFYQQAQSPPPSMTNIRGYQILAQFNMTAHQRGHSVTYPARSEGPHHTPTWHVQCCLDGQVRGEGSGQNQKQAKELAARQAWMAMGWGTLPEP